MEEQGPSGRRECARVALGEAAPTLVLRGGRVFSVFTDELVSGDVALCDGRIAGIGSYPDGPGIDITGRVVLPGFIDAHFHIESSMLAPGYFAQTVIPHGTTTVMEEPHELVNVVGPAGVDFFLAARSTLPLDLRVMLPSSVPASPFEEAAGRMAPEDVERLARAPGVSGLGEVMDYAGILTGGGIWEVISAAGGAPMDGHAPGVTGSALSAYLAAGPMTDHETSDPELLAERMRLGMWLLAREGSASRDLRRVIPFLQRYGTGRTCLCTDDRHAATLVEEHHLDGMIGALTDAGISTADAIRAATLNPATLYRLHDRGAVAPGLRADLVVVEDPAHPHPELVLSSGRVVAREGSSLTEASPAPPLGSPGVQVNPPDAEALLPPAPDGTHTARALRMLEGSLETREEAVRVTGRGGRVRLADDSDVAYAAVLERHRGTGLIGTGLVVGTGLRRGAVAATVAHDAHHLIVLGREPDAMLHAVHALRNAGGGLASADRDEVLTLPLPLAGLMTDRPGAEVAAELRALERRAGEFGLRLQAPFMAMSFMALSVIPELRVTARGLLRVDDREIVPVVG